MESMCQHVEIALVQTPAGIANAQSFDGRDDFSLNSFSPASLDDTEKGGTKTDIGHAMSLFRPGRKRWVLREKLYFFLELGR